MPKPSDFLADLENGRPIDELIHAHEGLLGILLGYGVESSMQYHKRDKMRKTCLTTFDKNAVLECAFLDYSTPASFCLPLCFTGDPASQEVKEILDQNAKERAHLVSEYAKGDFLKVTLQKLMEKDSS